MEPSVGDYENRGDGSFRLYVGGRRGWIICDDTKDLRYEIKKLEGGFSEEKSK